PEVAQRVGFESRHARIVPLVLVGTRDRRTWSTTGATRQRAKVVSFTQPTRCPWSSRRSRQRCAARSTGVKPALVLLVWVTLGCRWRLSLRVLVFACLGLTYRLVWWMG